jgi:hypothetical protein
VYVPEPYLPILGAIPTEMVKELCDRQNRQDGFFDRFLFTYVPTWVVPYWTDDYAPPESYQGWDGAVRRLYHRDAGVSLTLSPAAREAWRTLHDETVEEANDQMPPAMRGYWSKLRTYAGRLTLALHGLHVAYANDGWDVREVGAECVEGAWAIINYYKSQYRAVTAGMRGERFFGVMKALRTFLAGCRKDLEQGFTKNDLWKLARDKVTKGKVLFKATEDFTPYFHALVREALVVQDPDQADVPRRRGRRRVGYHLAPANPQETSANSAEIRPGT